MSIFDTPVKTAGGSETNLTAYAGQVVLVVNVASKCGLTPQYSGLETLYRTYKDRGLVILGFPCNQFGGQEPGSAEEIATYCSVNYDVTFPVFAKVDVNGKNTAPLFQKLKAEAPGLLGTKAIKWNFTKFLIDRNGNVAARFAPTTVPDEITAAIEKLL